MGDVPKPVNKRHMMGVFRLGNSIFHRQVKSSLKTHITQYVELFVAPMLRV